MQSLVNIINRLKMRAAQSEAIIYFKNKMTGRSYLDYYAERMDRHMERHPRWGLTLDKTFQLKFLRKHGLKKDMHFLDYGCGAVAAGVHFIEFLDAEKYVGIDLSKQVIEEAAKRVQAGALHTKRPNLIHTRKGQLNALAEMKFDVIWAHSVLTHLPPKEIKNLFKQLKLNMHSGSTFFATFGRIESGKIEQRDFKDWYYPLDFFETATKNCGLTLEVCEDWKYPDTEFYGKDTMLRIRLNPTLESRDQRETN